MTERNVPASVMAELERAESPDALLWFLTITHRDIGEPIRITASASSSFPATGRFCSIRSRASGNIPPIRDQGPLNGNSRTFISKSGRRAAAKQ